MRFGRACCSRRNRYAFSKKIMNTLNKLLSGLPILILVFWVVCLVFIDNELYAQYYFYINRIETYITGFALLHSGIYWEFYKKISKYCVRAIIGIVLLQVVREYCDPDFYYFAYFFIILQTILESIRVNLKAK